LIPGLSKNLKRSGGSSLFSRHNACLDGAADLHDINNGLFTFLDTYKVSNSLYFWIIFKTPFRVKN
jgi:hypothetical protein